MNKIQDQYTDLPISRCAKWRLRHPEKLQEYYDNKIYKEYKKEYQQTHKKEHNEANKKYRLTHKEEHKEECKIWWKNNPNRTREYYNKRKDLGFIFINDWFIGSEGHHLTKEYVIYIPKELHRSIYHNLQTGQNMNLINYEVFKWYYGFKPQSLCK